MEKTIVFVPVETSETVGLEAEFESLLDAVNAHPVERERIKGLLAPLRTKHPVTHQHYLHSLRVSITCEALARLLNLPPKPALYAGALHDIGKAQVPVDVLGKASGWNTDDARLMRRHVLDGWRLTRDAFDFSGRIILWHHRFQKKGYPVVLPRMPQKLSRATEITTAFYGKLLAIADTYDALHRVNDATGSVALSGAEIRTRLDAAFPGEGDLIAKAYEASILSL